MTSKTLPILAALGVLAFALPAAAYVDPTSAGVFLQNAYLLFVGGAVVVAAAPRRITSFLAGLLKRSSRD